MANIKFSQFTVGNTESDIDFVVGYKGGDNIQISPANLLSATLTGYLPLTGGTITGNVKFQDNVELRLGAGADLKAYHSGTNTLFDNNVGDLFFRNFANDKDIVFQSDDGSGGVTTYMFLDGSTTLVQFYKSTKHSDNIVANFGNSNDAQIYHSGTNGFINNNTGNLYITNYSDNEDIIFRCDDGAGGVATYFYLDGSLTTVTPRTVFPDDSVLGFGTGADLQIYHDGTTSNIANYTNNLSIINHFNDGDIKFFSDDGSGGVAEYFKLDGSLATGGTLYTVFPDNSRATFGNGYDLQIYHDATNSYIKQGAGGHLIIQQETDDGDIIFKSDDGSGGTTEYFRLDGSSEYNIFSKNLYLIDNVQVLVGTGQDLRIYHNGSNSFIEAYSGNLIIQNHTDDSNITFKSDDGSGGVANYMTIDGGVTKVTLQKDLRADDGVKIQVGGSGDLFMVHESDTSKITNGTGQLQITQNVADEDIVFKADGGSGSAVEYMRLDGSQVSIRMKRQVKWDDNIKATFGDGDDLQIYHDGTNSQLSNFTGDLKFINYADDKDIVFSSDDGSGGATPYFRLDGSDGNVKVYKQFAFLDNVRATFGGSGDLEIYHDGSDSIIKDGGTGSLDILSSHVHIKSSGGTNNMAQFFSGGNSYIYANNVLRIEATTSGAKVHGGLNITGVSEYADNTAAIAGGLTTGDVYRTGDLLKIVH